MTTSEAEHTRLHPAAPTGDQRPECTTANPGDGWLPQVQLRRLGIAPGDTDQVATGQHEIQHESESSMATPSPANGGYPKPTVGRIVHLRGSDLDATYDQPVAAIVTGVYNDGNNIQLQAWPPGADSIRPKTSIRHQSVAEPGEAYWTWPPRE